jgi:hypothetical protein
VLAEMASAFWGTDQGTLDAWMAQVKDWAADFLKTMKGQAREDIFC